MKLLITATTIVAICIAAMAISILLRKDGKFPDGEISHNGELRSKGIACAKLEETRLWGRKNSGRKADDNFRPECPEGGCEGCGLYNANSTR